MENKEQVKGNTPMPASPKPTDEIQLNIETVTPETEKNVVPSENAKERQAQQEQVDEEEGLKPDDDANETDDEAATAQEEEESETDEEAVSAEHTNADDEVKKEEDPGDDIETISP